IVEVKFQPRSAIVESRYIVAMHNHNALFSVLLSHWKRKRQNIFGPDYLQGLKPQWLLRRRGLMTVSIRRKPRPTCGISWMFRLQVNSPSDICVTLTTAC